MKIDTDVLKASAIGHLLDTVRLVDAIQVIERLVQAPPEPDDEPDAVLAEIAAARTKAITVRVQNKIKAAMAARPPRKAKRHPTKEASKFMQDYKGRISSGDLARELGWKQDATRIALENLVKKGEVQRFKIPSSGRYGHSVLYGRKNSKASTAA